MHPSRLRTFVLALALLVVGSFSAEPSRAATPIALTNLDFEQGEVGQAPPDWSVSEDDRRKGYAAQTVGDGAEAGVKCLLFRTPTAPEGYGFGELVRPVDATPLRAKAIRFRAAVRFAATSPGQRARLWIAFERPGKTRQPGGELRSDPITLPTWKRYEVLAEVPPDATRVLLGLAVVGDAKAWLDSAALEVLGEAGAGREPARPLSERGLQNLRAFARLYGYVRFFHPSDEAAGADWNALALAGVQRAERAATAQELARSLTEIFQPLAPALRIYPTAGPKPAPDLSPAQPPEGAIEIVSWKHAGVDLSGGTQATAYSSRREARPLKARGVAPGEPLLADLGGGVTASVPLALYKDGKGTLPHAAPPRAAPVPDKPEGFVSSGDDRATRLADVVIAWNVFQHFYPYFEVVKTDWPAVLPTALRSAASDPDAAAFSLTLRRLVAALHDGHGGVYSPGSDGTHRPPFLWDWVEDRLVVSSVDPQGADGAVRGDVVTRIDGRPTAEALAAEEALTSGATPQWIRFRALESLLAGPPDRELKLELRHADGTPATITLKRTQALDSAASSNEPRPEKLSEIRPGIFYLDVNRITDDDVKGAMDRLAQAKGIVIDFRGYPSRLSPILIAHLIDKPVTSAQWHIPRFTRPDRVGMEFDFSNWPVAPEAPRFQGKVAFLINGEAISYAETYMGIVEHYKLGALVGGPTAGTNGNVNPLTLPGGYRVAWTGMQVLKHDGSRHHGVGILPTVPVARTLAGVAAGRDEVLEKGIEVVSQ